MGQWVNGRLKISKSENIWLKKVYSFLNEAKTQKVSQSDPLVSHSVDTNVICAWFSFVTYGNAIIFMDGIAVDGLKRY